ncbi:MAG: fibronectin I domain-containing [Geobacteraceae bacterium]|nr:MAG: fibronectin I domain-containing [Geobacteraceae bacterium]
MNWSGRALRFFFLWALLATALTACGKKGPLIYPEAQVPAPVTALKVEQKGELFLISWPQPDREERGERLKDLAGFRLFKREVLPPAEDCEECPTAYRLIKTVDVEYLQDVVRLDGRYFFSDAELAEGKTYQYKVVSFKGDGTESGPSNRARKKRVAPPIAPKLKALSTPAGVMLTWEPVTLPEHAGLVGYNVYRKRPGEVMPPAPLNSEPLTGTRYEDLRLERGATYAYSLRTAARIGGETVESEPSNETVGELTDPE